jgi:hypothetical protein
MDAGAAVIHPTTHFSCVNGMASRIHKDAVKPRTPCRQSVLPKKKRLQTPSRQPETTKKQQTKRRLSDASLNCRQYETKGS